jgi:hypothetical protein
MSVSFKTMLSFNLSLSVTLTLEITVRVLYMTYCLIIVNIYAKYFQNPLINEKVMHWKQNLS